MVHGCLLIDTEQKEKLVDQSVQRQKQDVQARKVSQLCKDQVGPDRGYQAQARGGGGNQTTKKLFFF